MAIDESASSDAANEQREGMTDADEPKLTLAEKLNRCFAEKLRPDGKPYSNDEVGARIGKSGSYLWSLRNGKQKNPSKEVLQALAAFFEKRSGYFMDDEPDPESRAVSEELRLLGLLADTGVRRIAPRLAGLSPASQQMVEAVIDRIREIEGLDPGNGIDTHGR